jgi:hypothetical protein
MCYGFGFADEPCQDRGPPVGGKERPGTGCAPARPSSFALDALRGREDGVDARGTMGVGSGGGSVSPKAKGAPRRHRALPRRHKTPVRGSGHPAAITQFSQGAETEPKRLLVPTRPSPRTSNTVRRVPPPQSRKEVWLGLTLLSLMLPFC